MKSFHLSPLALASLALLAALPAVSRAQAAAAAEGGTLPVVTVTATMSEHEVRTAPASTTVITREDLQQRSASDLLEALRDAPGFTFSPRQVGGRKTIALRGLEGKHTLTLIDGRRISPTDDVVGHSDYQYGWVPMSAVERIEVVRGPMSALYGSEALGGVINIITRKSLERWVGTAGMNIGMGEGQGNDSVGASLFATGPIGNGLTLRVNGDYHASEPVPDGTDPRVSLIEGRETRAAGLGVAYAISKDQSLELGWSGARERRQYDALSGTRVYENTYNIDRDQAHLTWQGRFGGVRSQLRAYRSEVDVLNARTNGVSATRPQHLKDDVADGFVAFSAFGQQLTLGGEWRRETLVNAGLVGGEDDATHQALFLQDEIAFTDALVLTAGVRQDRHELFGSETSPRAYLVWQASPELVLKGGFGHAFKAPTLKQISPNYVGAEGPHTFLGNADIQPESSNSFELAADWTSGPLNLRASLFRTDLRDLITYRLVSQVGSRRTYQYDNVDKARITGLEAGLGWAFARGWRWNTDVTLLRTEDRTTGEDLADRPETSLATHVAWQGADGWNARVGGAYTGSQNETAGARLPAYWLWNASVGKSFGKQWRLRAGVENLGNVNLAEKSADFGYAERARRVFVSGQLEF